MVSSSLKSAVHKSANKSFLRRLYRLQGTERAAKNKLINWATKSQLEVLINILKCVVSGEIPLRKAHFDRVKQSKRLNFLHKHFQDKNGFQVLQSSPVKEQRAVLRQINTYHQLLYNIFHHEAFDD
jgi:hypothetical protein